MKRYLVVLLVCSLTILKSQAPLTLKGTLSWLNTESKNFTSEKLPYFDNAHYTDKEPKIPIIMHQFDWNSGDEFQIELLVKASKAWIAPRTRNIYIPDNYTIRKGIFTENKLKKGWIEISAIRNVNGQVELLTDYEINITPSARQFDFSPAPRPYTNKSILSDGSIYKIAISENGVYKIDKDFLEKTLKINTSGLDPRKISIYGNGGHKLAESNAITRVDDLQELAIFINGENDGSFDNNDNILFYATGPDKLFYQAQSNQFLGLKNVYSEKSYYYLKINSTLGKRIKLANQLAPSANLITVSLNTIRHEKESLNLLDYIQCGHGSGQDWIGEALSANRVNDFKDDFIFPNIVKDSLVSLYGKVLARSNSTSSIKANLNTNNVTNTIFQVSISDCTSQVANEAAFFVKSLADKDNVAISLEPQIASSVSYEAWLDFLQVSAYVRNIYSNKPIHIFNPSTVNQKQNTYELESSVNDMVVWNISDISNVEGLPLQTKNNKITFTDLSDNVYKNYIAFASNYGFKNPEFISNIENQNIHSIQDADLIIIYHKDFKDEAIQLKKHREDFSKLKVEAVDIAQIYNEFGSGSPDPTSVRDFLRMVYSRSSNLKYLILFGDASFDYRYLSKKTNDENFVPTYETSTSFHQVDAFPSDDYFGLLDDNEGDNLDGMLDLSIGRILARTKAEASNQIKKIIDYDISAQSLGDWRLNMIFAADDEDINIHLDQMETIADETKSKLYNIQKIYFDAFDQVSTPGGERYPEATKALNASVFNGALTMSYMGHGGPTGLAQERVLLDDDIRKWDNVNRLPLLITATCSFNAFDDATITNAGEFAIHNKAGAIALYSTVRAVYSDDNFQLTRAVHNKLFEKTNNRYYTIGEILKIAKNLNSSGGIKLNSRKFMLFGDPSQTLAYPKHTIAITSINDRPLQTIKDTFKALDKLTIKGYIQDINNVKLSNFNGELNATVFDKEITLKTKGNDPGSNPYPYNIQKNIIFKGSANIINGEWEFSFYIPKDINYEFGAGKISLYASDLKSQDAASYYDAFLIGGFSKDTFTDDKPPVVQLYINDDKFVSGGITNQTPKLYAKVSDDLGINITGNSIGHDLTGVLDNDNQNPIILNNYFKSKLNDAREGEILYPLNELKPGKHTLSLTAWDISNKMGQAAIEFYVIDNDQVSLDRIYNYPNPFTTNTEFQFESNLVNTDMVVTVRIQSVSGKIVKTIQQKIKPTGNRITGIQWDGRDDYSAELANGVYLYTIQIHSEINGQSISKTSNYQKLVKLK